MLEVANIESSNASPLKINLGCGDKSVPGYLNVDIVDERASNMPDIVCDIRDLSIFESNIADEVMAIHVIEHFYHWEVGDLLREWVRVLKPGGKLILECPNLLAACHELIADPEVSSLPGPTGQRTTWVFYGDPAWKDPLMCHRWGYTPASLGLELMNVGLEDLKQEPAQFKLREPRDMRITGKKPVCVA